MKILIRRWSIRRRLTLTELASKAGISKGYFSKVERNKLMIRMDKLEDLAQVLEVCPKDLIHCEIDINCRFCSYNCINKSNN